MRNITPGEDEIVFFFQAEDGIRDTSVTGVQTCALPISRDPQPSKADRPGHQGSGSRFPDQSLDRSEERRVGKECRSRWWRYHLEKNEEICLVHALLYYVRNLLKIKERRYVVRRLLAAVT